MKPTPMVSKLANAISTDPPQCVDQLGLLGEDFEDTNEDLDEDICLPPNEGVGDSGEDNVSTTHRCKKEPNKYMIK